MVTLLYPRSTYTMPIPLVREVTQAGVEIVETKERKELMVKRAIEAVKERREIREGKVLKVTMAIPVTMVNQLQAPKEEKAETERTANRAPKARLETKVHLEIREKEDRKAILANQVQKLAAAPMDLKERLGPEETKVTEVSKVLREIVVPTTHPLSDPEEIRAKLARRALEVIAETLVVKAPMVLRERKDRRDRMVESVQQANKVQEVLVDHAALTAFPAASKPRKTSDSMKKV